jgi:hypothetical protein
MMIKRLEIGGIWNSYMSAEVGPLPDASWAACQTGLDRESKYS